MSTSYYCARHNRFSLELFACCAPSLATAEAAVRLCLCYCCLLLLRLPLPLLPPPLLLLALLLWSCSVCFFLLPIHYLVLIILTLVQTHTCIDHCVTQ